MAGLESRISTSSTRGKRGSTAISGRDSLRVLDQDSRQGDRSRSSSRRELVQEKEARLKAQESRVIQNIRTGITNTAKIAIVYIMVMPADFLLCLFSFESWAHLAVIVCAVFLTAVTVLIILTGSYKERIFRFVAIPNAMFVLVLLCVYLHIIGPDAFFITLGTVAVFLTELMSLLSILVGKIKHPRLQNLLSAISIFAPPIGAVLAFVLVRINRFALFRFGILSSLVASWISLLFNKHSVSIGMPHLLRTPSLQSIEPLSPDSSSRRSSARTSDFSQSRRSSTILRRKI